MVSADVYSGSVEPIDVYFVMYGVQTFIMLSVLLWTVSNIIQHVHLIIWHSSMQVQWTLQQLEPPGMAGD